MSFASWVSFLSALLLSFTVIRSGLGKFTSQVTDEVHERYLVQKKKAKSAKSSISLSPEATKEVRGIIDLVCGVLLLVPSLRKIGAAIAFALLMVGLVRCIRSGTSLIPPLVMMSMSAFVWFT
jgi:uncharacterized membrane protein YphA (DoxX/SURF4 family)